jgi:hypothetical protein
MFGCGAEFGDRYPTVGEELITGRVGGLLRRARPIAVRNPLNAVGMSVITFDFLGAGPEGYAVALCLKTAALLQRILLGR